MTDNLWLAGVLFLLGGLIFALKSIFGGLFRKEEEATPEVTSTESTSTEEPKDPFKAVAEMAEEVSAPETPPVPFAPKRHHDCPMCAAGHKPVERYIYNAVIKEGGVDKPVIMTLPKALHERINNSDKMPIFWAIRDPKVASNKPEVRDWFRPNDGTYRIRLLPNNPLLTTKDLYVIRRQHYLPDPVYGQMHGSKPIMCRKRLKNGKWEGDCPICDEWKRMWVNIGIAEGKGEWEVARKLKTQATQIKPMMRHYFNVSVYDEASNVWSEPRLWSAGIQVFTMLKAYIEPESSDEEAYELFDPIKGCDITIIVERRHHGFPSFKVMPRYKTRPIGDDHFVSAMLANLWDIEEVTKQWEASPQDMEEAMYKAKVIPTLKKCVTCSKRLRTDNSDVIYCSENCLKERLRPGRCPMCATEKVIDSNGQRIYLAQKEMNGCLFL